MARCRANRRNTMDCALLNDIFIDDDTRKSDKRSIQLLRESERDIKLSSGIIQPTTGMISPNNVSPSKSSTHLAANAVDAKTKVNRSSTIGSVTGDDECLRNMGRMCISTNLTSVPKLVESSNRYMSVSSRPVGCRSSAPPLAFHKDAVPLQTPCVKSKAIVAVAGGKIDNSMLQSRQVFHETFANLIKLGSTDKQESKLSSEDYTWQTELKDMIWLELQAWHADRSIEQQDKYLYSARQGIPDLLKKILNYRCVDLSCIFRTRNRIFDLVFMQICSTF